MLHKLHNFSKCFIRPLSIRYSDDFFRKDSAGQSLIRQTLDQSNQMTTNECHELREKVLQCVPKRSTINVDQTILQNCLPNQLNIGKSYIDYLRKSDLELKVGTVANFLQLYYRASKHGIELTSKDQQEIIEMYQYVLEKFKVFDKSLGLAVIRGLVLTDDWRKSLDVLDSIKSIDSKAPMFAYSAIIQRAIQENDERLVWNLLNNIATECDVLDNEVFIAYIRYCEHSESSFTENINKMLTFIGQNQILVSTDVVNEFQRVFQRFNHSCHITNVSKQGKCHACRKRLRGAEVTDDEFNNLRSHFLDKALIGNNIFTKSTPQELKSFNAFIDRTMPYDCVIDGLNVALMTQSSNNAVQATMLANAVKHFVDRRKTILVVGRQHMQRWPKAQMNYIRNNANLFLMENLSQDDPFFLYSALKSGPNTDFATRDLIRDHAFKMDDKLKIVFRRWQQQHQYMIKFIKDDGHVIFENRIDFDMNAQQVDEGGWHIPFEDSSHCKFQQTYFELHKNWLCVSKS